MSKNIKIQNNDSLKNKILSESATKINNIAKK